MNTGEKRDFLIRQLVKESPEYEDLKPSGNEEEDRKLLRALMNVRMPAEISAEFAQIQDEYLQEINAQRGIVSVNDLEQVLPGIYLWQGDITRLSCDAIVNAANSGMTGCYQPCHSCIDNCIHTYAGIQLRNTCRAIMDKQGHPEPTGQAKITPAYNLPSRYILHTVGPIVTGEVTPEDDRALASCYEACLEMAKENDLHSIAFCCISTGVFHFPNERAARIAVNTVQNFCAKEGNEIEVIFNVWKDEDDEIYRRLLR